MEPVDEYEWIMITMVVSFIISMLVFFNAERKWLGCILQFFTFIALVIFSGMLFGMCRGFVDSSNESEAMKNKLMPMWDKVMLRKRCIIETINDMLKNTAQLVHSRHKSVNNFIMSMIAALAAYYFFDNKPHALEGYCVENTKQLMLF